jgi:hypothetical protein
MRLRPVLIAAAVAATSLLIPAGPASASVPHYANCTKMHVAAHGKYKGGIARKGARDHRAGGGHAKYKPYVSTSYYNANKKMDRDKDGIACEQ